MFTPSYFPKTRTLAKSPVQSKFMAIARAGMPFANKLLKDDLWENNENILDTRKGFCIRFYKVLEALDE